MSEPQMNNVELSTAPPIIEGTPENTKINTNTSLTIIRSAASTALYAVSSTLGRKAILTGTLYLAGGALVSSFGLMPVVAVSTLMWLL